MAGRHGKKGRSNFHILNDHEKAILGEHGIGPVQDLFICPAMACSGDGLTTRRTNGGEVVDCPKAIKGFKGLLQYGQDPAATGSPKRTSETSKTI